MSGELTPVEKKPSFWDSKDGTWGMVIGVLLLVGIGWGAMHLLPLLNALLIMTAATIWHTIIVAVLICLLVGLIYVTVIDDSLRKLMLLKYQIFVKGLRRSIVDENPISILKLYMDKAQKRMQEVRKGKDMVRAQKVQTEQVLDSFKKDFTKFVSEAKALENKPDKVAAWRSACGNMAKAAEAGKRTAQQLAMISGHYERLRRAEEDLALMYADMKYENTVLERDFVVSGALANVWGVVRAAFKGDTEWDQLREEAIDSINQKYADRMGMVESAIDDCQKKMDSIELTQEIHANNGTDIYNQLKDMTPDQIFAVTPPTPVAIGNSPVQGVPTEIRSYAEMMRK